MSICWSGKPSRVQDVFWLPVPSDLHFPVRQDYGYEYDQISKWKEKVEYQQFRNNTGIPIQSYVQAFIHQKHLIFKS